MWWLQPWTWGLICRYTESWRLDGHTPYKLAWHHYIAASICILNRSSDLNTYTHTCTWYTFAYMYICNTQFTIHIYIQYTIYIHCKYTHAKDFYIYFYLMQYTYVYVYRYMYVIICIYFFGYDIYIYIYVYVRICMYIYVYIYMYICI